MNLTMAAFNELKNAKKKGGRLIKVPSNEGERAVVFKEDKSRNFTSKVAYMSVKTTAELKNILSVHGDAFFALNYVLNNF